MGANIIQFLEIISLNSPAFIKHTGIRTKRKPLLLHHCQMSGTFTLTWVYSLIQQIEVGFSCVHN